MRTAAAREAFCSWCSARAESGQRRMKLSMLGTAFFSLAANGFSYMNFTPQHDALIESFWYSRSHLIGLGRFLLNGYMVVRGKLPMPWAAGMLSMLFLGLSVYLLTRTLRMDTRAEILLTAGFMSANLCITSLNAVFQYFSDAYMFALLTACLGAYLLSLRPGLLNGAAAAASLLVSLGIYPAFFPTACVILLLVILREVLECNGFTREIWKKIGYWAVVMAVTAVLFVACAKLSLVLTGWKASVRKNSLYSFGSVGLGELLRRTAVNYYYFISSQLLGFSPLDGMEFLGKPYGAASIALTVLCVGVFVKRHWGKVRGGVLCLFLLSAALFPFIARSVNIMTGNGQSHRTMYTQYIYHVFLLWLLFLDSRGGASPDRIEGKGRTVPIAAALSVVLLLSSIGFSNQAYTVSKVLYDRAMVHTAQVMEDLRDQGYSKAAGDTAVAAGTFELDRGLRSRLSRFDCLGGFYDSSVTYTDTFRSEARLLGYDVAWSGEEVDAAVLEDMPAYPESGYIRIVDGVYVIKLS